MKTIKLLLLSLCLIFGTTTLFSQSKKGVEIPPLPYATDALVPKMSKTTVELHWGKHVQGYVNNLNNLIVNTPFANQTLEHIVKYSSGVIYNNAAQIWNHIFFFDQFRGTPKQTLPTGELLSKINNSFGSFIEFRNQFTKASLSLFGSGWVWLVENEAGKLSIIQEINAGCPLTRGLKPLLVCDVWEHAYYVDSQNRRAEYLDTFWSLIEWSIIDKR